uniref:Uncharacterized protein n=1 Tax=Anguilla anguilla TaxID=7936 RepID=A0A0E9W1L7_ANGAN
MVNLELNNQAVKHVNFSPIQFSVIQ